MESKVIVANEVGELFCLNGECEFEMAIQNSPKHLLKTNWCIHCIIPFSKGFIVGGDNCQIFIYKFSNDSQVDFIVTQLQVFFVQIKLIAFLMINFKGEQDSRI